jgi:hypothetical protein
MYTHIATHLHHVDECIAHVALVFEVNGEVKEIVGALKKLVHCG